MSTVTEPTPTRTPTKPRSSSLQILMIGSLPPPLGGTAISFRQLIRELCERSDVGVRVIDTSSIRSGAIWNRSASALRLFLSAARQLHQIDIATLHTSPPGMVAFGWALFLLCRLFRKPLVLRIFGGSLDVEFKEMGILSQSALALLFRAEAVLLQTHHQLAYFQRRFPFAHGIWFSNSRPLDVGFDRERLERRPRHFVFIGQVKPTKGLTEIFAAADSISDPDIEIDVYGPLHDGMTASVFDKAERVHYKGVLEPSAVIPTLRRYDVLLLPTYHYGEGYPGIVLEAYSVGVPVIATRWRALPEIVDDEVSGILIEPRDAEGLKRAICRVAESSELMARLSAGALSQANKFDSRVWADRFVSICRAAATRDWTAVE
jgi:glycosyltransferase involved in cell wall biosynthesis